VDRPVTGERPRFPYDEDSDWVLAEAAKLDPGDSGERAEYLRQVAQSVRDHREMARRRAEWAAQDATRQAAQQRFGR